MKLKLYTQSYSLDLLQQLKTPNELFTAKEHAWLTERERGDICFQDKEALMRHYLTSRATRLGVLEFIGERVRRHGYRRVLSLGAGECVLEYLLHYVLPKGASVLATDFDAYFISKARHFFPEIRSETFDFVAGDISILGEADLAMFLGSAYVMDDSNFIRVFQGLKAAGVREVVDFHGG